ncbi:MAG: V-type proton ATPase subunit D, partial [Marteilia pararefringens]
MSPSFSVDNIIALAPESKLGISLNKFSISTAGVTYRQFEIIDTKHDEFRSLSMVKGKESIETVKRNFRDLATICVQIASTKMSFNQVNQARKSTNSMTNSLEFN